MRTMTRALGWIVLGTVAAVGCGGGGTSGSGTGGSGAGTGGGNGGTGVAGSSAAGTNGAAGTAAGGSTAGTSGAGTAGTGGTTGTAGGSGGSPGGRGGATGGGSGGGAAGSGGSSGGGGGGNAGGAGGRGGGAGTGTAGAGGGSAGRGGTGGGTGGTGTGGVGGSTGFCTGHALSLATNATGTAADTAYAHVEIDLGSDLPIGNSQRTIEFWAFIKTTDWVGENNEVYYYGTSGNAASFGLDFGTNTVTGMSSNHATLNPFTGGSAGFTVDSTADLGINSSTDQWVHIAMVWNGTNVITYVNGLPKITAAGTGGATMLATGQSVLTIGCNPSNNNCFNGLFDEFRVWNVARTATQIQNSYKSQLAGNETGLVGYWRFDEASGTTTADAVSTAGHTKHAGTLKANTTALPTFVTPPTPVPVVCP